MDFFEVVRRRRSVRHFTADPVRHEDLITILDAARQAPSATNEQPWRFLAIRDQGLKAALGEMVNAIIDTQVEAVDEERRRRQIAYMRFYSTHFASAPVAIAVLARPWMGTGHNPSRELGVASVAKAVLLINLAATALGYGSCFASGPAEFAGRELEALLGVEEPWFLLGIISLGVPARMPKEVSRKPLGEIVTFIG